MCNTLKLSGLFVCLGGLTFFSVWMGGGVGEQKKLLGCGLLGRGGVSTQADLMGTVFHSGLIGRGRQL